MQTIIKKANLFHLNHYVFSNLLYYNYKLFKQFINNQRQFFEYKVFSTYTNGHFTEGFIQIHSEKSKSDQIC